MTSETSQYQSEQMFLGEHPRSVDQKGRTTLPAVFRDALGDEAIILTRGFEQCVFLFPRSFFELWRQKVRALPLTDPLGRTLRRVIFSGAAEIAPDSQGRILLPDWLREYAGLSSNVIMAGNDAYIEIWDADEWAGIRNSIQNSPAHAEAWSKLNI